MNVIAFDFETWLIGPGNVAPPPVCMSVATRIEGDTYVSLVGNGDGDFRDQVWSLLSQEDAILVGHNVAYDLSVIIRAFPEFEPRIWALLEDGRITDTMVREKLLNLSTHGQLDKLKFGEDKGTPIKYGLADLVLKHLGYDLTKEKQGEDAVRLSYGELDGEKAADYPEEFAEYAKHDALYTLLVYEAQQMQVRSETGPASLSTEFFHTAAHFALNMMTLAGMRIDPVKLAEVEAMLVEEQKPEKLKAVYDANMLNPPTVGRPYARELAKALDECGLSEEPADWSPWKQRLLDKGFKFTGENPKIKKNTNVIKALVERICKDHGIEIKRTDKGGVSTDAEVVRDLSDFDPAMKEYAAWQKLQKLVTTEIPRMKWDGLPAERVHFNFNVLVRTTRTSSYASSKYPSGNGQQIDPRVRPCYIPTPGYVLCASDYASLELCTTAQQTFSLFGFSEHRERIMAGDDLHAFLGAQLAAFFHDDFRALLAERGVSGKDSIYREFLGCKGHEVKEVSDFFAFYRKLAKPVGLGLPGGLGIETFIKIAKKTYRVDIVEIASKVPDDRFEITDKLLNFCKRKFKWKPEDFQWTPYTKAAALAIRLKDLWLETYPEMAAYFEWVQTDCDDPNNPIIGYKVDEDTGEKKPVKGLAYVSPMGMYRAGTNFCGAANGFCMQTPAAEGAKIAVFKVVRACRDWTQESPLFGCIAVNFIHDEILIEIPEDERLDERVRAFQALMQEAMQIVTPDVPSKTEAAIMRRWDKRAEPRFDDNGRIVLWTPPDDKSTDSEEGVDQDALADEIEELVELEDLLA